MGWMQDQMKREIITYNNIEGFHCWPDAPKQCEYLSSRHRHIFIIRTWLIVSHNDREIEINIQGLEIKKMLEEKFGSPCEFGQMSCESIAQFILHKIPAATRCEVLEDGYAGASLSR